MKKLLSMIAVSTLVGTIASNSKPMFANTNVSHSFKSNQLNNKDISITNQNVSNPFEPAQINNNITAINKVIVTPNGTIWVGTNVAFGSGRLYKASDGIHFKEINFNFSNIYSLISDKIGNIWVGSENGIFYKSNGIDVFTPMSGITGSINSLAVDKDNNIYACSSYSDNKVYKSTNGSTFTPMTGTTGTIKSLVTDNVGNVYAGSLNGTVYKSNGTDVFTPMSGVKGRIHSLAVDKDNNIYASSNIYGSTNGTVYKSNGIDVFTPMSGITGSINSLAVDKDNNIYVGTDNGLYKSTDKINFKKNNKVFGNITSIFITSDKNMLFSISESGLYIINPLNLLFKITKPDNFDKSWLLYNGIVYNSAQKIDIKKNLIASAILDGNSITVPSTDVDIDSGEHTLILTLKDKLLASIFGGDVSTGQVVYKLWVKTSINKNQIDYQTKIDDTQLYTGLISNAGNTNNTDIIQTKIKDGTGTHDASLNINFKDILVDFDVNKSFYEQGTVDEVTNNFTVTGSKQGVSKNLSIQNDGIYHLHLVDTVGNKYESYLELGESNWKLKGTFDDSELDKLKSKLNVTVNLANPTQKRKALGWLHQYENFVDKIFEETIKTNGKGFDSEIKNQITDYKSFLKSLTYEPNNEPKFDDGLDKSALVTTITDKAKKTLNKGLDALPKNLNVNTSNVVNKSTLEHYTNWINNYQDFINKNKDTWINDISNIASRGFATTEQENQIKSRVSKFWNNDNIKNYLKNVVWEDNKLLKATSNDYQQYVKLDELQKDTIEWVNTNMSEINTAYENAIKNAESGLNLHGYSIDKILNGKSKPQTKTEIDNFADGQSYHDWLQSQANIKFRGWQLAMGFGIALPLLLVVVAIAWVIRRKTDPRYNGTPRARKETKQDKKRLAKTLKEEEKHNKK